MLDHVDLWGVDIALLYIAEDTIQVNSELPAALGPWRKGHSKAVTALSLDALGRRASKVCHVIFADVIGWPGTVQPSSWSINGLAIVGHSALGQ